MEHLDSSIPTMEKILTILHDAETNKEQTPPRKVRETSSLVSSSSDMVAADKSPATLGLRALDYNIYRLLNDTEIVYKYSVFENIKPETCEYILKQHAEILREKFLWSNDSLSLSSIGQTFASRPSRLHHDLSQQLSSKLKRMLVDYDRVKRTQKFAPDFSNIKLPNPSRGKVRHPMTMRKGLNFDKKPLHLFCFMIDDHDVLSAFLGKLRSYLSPSLILNFMKSQALEGGSAFDLLMTKHLKYPEGQYFEGHPIDSFGQTPIAELEWDLNVVKAIVAHKSNLLSRLDSLGIYKDSISYLQSSKIKDTENVVKILAGSFDRYFSACYRLDEKYCDDWVAGLLAYYRDNWDEKTILEAHFQECVNDFRDKITAATLRRLSGKWVPKSYEAGKKLADNQILVSS